VVLSEALRQGYLFVHRGIHGATIQHNLERLWGWRCAAAGHPEIVMATVLASDAVRIRGDLFPTTRRGAFAMRAGLSRTRARMPCTRGSASLTPGTSPPRQRRSTSAAVMRRACHRGSIGGDRWEKPWCALDVTTGWPAARPVRRKALLRSHST
jgi:hypothetical protein